MCSGLTSFAPASSSSTEVSRVSVWFQECEGTVTFATKTEEKNTISSVYRRGEYHQWSRMIRSCRETLGPLWNASLTQPLWAVFKALTWPTTSPDLNPVKHPWDVLITGGPTSQRKMSANVQAPQDTPRLSHYAQHFRWRTFWVIMVGITLTARTLLRHWKAPKSPDFKRMDKHNDGNSFQWAQCSTGWVAGPTEEPQCGKTHITDWWICSVNDAEYYSLLRGCSF